MPGTSRIYPTLSEAAENDPLVQRFRALINAPHSVNSRYQGNALIEVGYAHLRITPSKRAYVDLTPDDCQNVNTPQVVVGPQGLNRQNTLQ